MTEETATPPHPGSKWLSDRELEVLGHVGDGQSNEVIAGLMGLAPDSVKSHLLRINKKLGTGDRAHAYATAVRTGQLGFEAFPPAPFPSDWETVCRARRGTDKQDGDKAPEPRRRAKPETHTVTIFPASAQPEAARFSITVTAIGPNLWGIHHNGKILNRHNLWNELPEPYLRTGAWAAAHGFELPEAMRRARAAAPGVQVGGFSAAAALDIQRRCGHLPAAPRPRNSRTGNPRTAPTTKEAA